MVSIYDSIAHAKARCLNSPLPTNLTSSCLLVRHAQHRSVRRPFSPRALLLVQHSGFAILFIFISQTSEIQVPDLSGFPIKATESAKRNFCPSFKVSRATTPAATCTRQQSTTSFGMRARRHATHARTAKKPKFFSVEFQARSWVGYGSVNYCSCQRPAQT
ncbi:hypothetical protein EI94DRAFT_1724825, partial [Lactarius quietus]